MLASVSATVRKGESNVCCQINMNYINEAVVVCQLLANDLKSNLEKKKRRRRMWVRKWISYREEKGAATNLCRELEVEDPKQYRNFFRITSEEFNFLLNRVQRRLQKQDTVMREALPFALKLEITLRYLATGDSFNFTVLRSDAFEIHSSYNTF
jgi:hypothetical protein